VPTAEGSAKIPDGVPTADDSAQIPEGVPTADGSAQIPEGVPTAEGSAKIPDGVPTDADDSAKITEGVPTDADGSAQIPVAMSVAAWQQWRNSDLPEDEIESLLGQPANIGMLLEKATRGGQFSITPLGLPRNTYVEEPYHYYRNHIIVIYFLFLRFSLFPL